MRIKLLAIFFCVFFSAAAHAQPITWHPWTPDVFTQAKREHKFVLLDLQAVWCHWCHVMDDTTYTDPKVQKLLADKYIAVKVDQDSRPDLSNRYEDYGWPATVVFAADASEIVKRRGYLPPPEMASMLQAIIDDPTPGPSITPTVTIHPASNASLTPELRKQLEQKFRSTYDEKNAGWGHGFKFIDADSIEYSLQQARAGDRGAEQMARQTLTAGLQLLDPAWGGVYQYSTDGDWLHPHFEKIMSFQSDDLRTYSRAYLQLHDPAYLRAAQSIQSFLTRFLTSPQGAFYTSQDADLHPGQHSADYFKLNDADRQKLGIPRVDTHIYSRENGWAIQGILELYAATGPDSGVVTSGDHGPQIVSAKTRALRAANWIIANRSLPNGGFRHDEKDSAGPYLGDTLAMGRAFLSLYRATADRQWLPAADAAAQFIEKNFCPDPKSGAGVLTAAISDGPTPVPQIDENIATARFARLLFAYTGNEKHQQLAESAMRYLASPQVAATRNWLVGGILLAGQEMNSVPLHITIVGPKSDPAAQKLFTTALAAPLSYMRLEWYDPADGILPHADVEFPKLPHPAAFFCNGNACSSPIYDPAALAKKLSSPN